MGNVMISVEKTTITIFRLPFMGIIFSMVCLIRYTVKLPAVKQKNNKIIWSIVALIGSLKMGIAVKWVKISQFGGRQTFT
jgi:hypothetical protein